ncbi:MAG TPA: serine/threonine-protein kinase [Gemmatimonadaceae bacterium]|nr:serine/threonine-protein kinase [Gemmatimonadaceae bacterium]
MPDSGITSIGKYRILDLVGEGAMGVVYRATDSVLNRTVAVKVMSDAIARQADLRDRFLREAQAAGSLQHPNVITVYDFGEVNGHLYIAMEYVEGVDLETLLAMHQPLTLQAKLDLAIGVLNGLSYAHRRGIVHRDIKPANIRVTEEGTAKIMDFGVARLESSDMTRTGMMVGTPSYMSPEQVTGTTVTPAADIFSFGAVLYELLSGAKAFEGQTLHGILFKIVGEEPPDLLALLPGLPPALGRIVKKALAKDPGQRYRSALDMANELSAVRAALSGPPTAGTLSLRASVETAVAAHRREATRTQLYRAALVSAGTLAVAVIAVLVWSIASPHRNGGVAIVAPGGVLPAAPTVATAVPATTRAGSAPAAPLDTESAAGTVVDGAAGVAATPSRDPRPPAYSASRSAAPSAAAMRAMIEGRRALAAERARYVAESLRIHPDSAAVLARIAAAAAALPPPARPPSATRPAPSIIAPPSAGSTATTAAPAVTSPQPASPAAPAPSPAPTTLAANPTAEIAAVVAAYARAIESRDIAEVRRAYPGLTETQQRGFEQFFAAARSLRVSFQLSGVDAPAGATTAEANLVGSYDYVAEGKNEHQPVSFHASLRREGGAWKLTSVR